MLDDACEDAGYEHRADHEQTLHRRLVEGRYLQQVEDVGKQAERDRAEYGACHDHPTAAEQRSTEHHRGQGIQGEPSHDRGVAGTCARHQQERRQRCEDSADQVCLDQRPAHRDPAKMGDFPVSSHGHDICAGAGTSNRPDRHRGKCQDHREHSRHRSPVTRNLSEASRNRTGRNGAYKERDTLAERQRTERYQEGLDSTRHEQAVEGADRKRDPHCEHECRRDAEGREGQCRHHGGDADDRADRKIQPPAADRVALADGHQQQWHDLDCEISQIERRKKYRTKRSADGDERDAKDENRQQRFA